MAKKHANQSEKVPDIKAAVAAEMAAAELSRVLLMQQLLGDPRVRVQVPTDGVSAEQQHSFPLARRYSIG